MCLVSIKVLYTKVNSFSERNVDEKRFYIKTTHKKTTKDSLLFHANISPKKLLVSVSRMFIETKYILIAYNIKCISFFS